MEINIRTKMTAFIKAMLKKSGGQLNIDKYRVSSHKILQNIKSEQNLMNYVMKQLKTKW